MMKEAKQKRALLIIIAILFVANVITLVMLFSHRPGHKKEDRNSKKSSMEAYLKKDLSFTDAQLATFDSLHKKHMAEVDKMFADMRLEKEKRFKYLAAEGFSDSTIFAAAAIMAEKQKALEIRMLQHLREVRGISTPEQMGKFDTTFLKFMSREKDKKNKTPHN